MVLVNYQNKILAKKGQSMVALEGGAGQSSAVAALGSNQTAASGGNSQNTSASSTPSSNGANHASSLPPVVHQPLQPPVVIPPVGKQAGMKRGGGRPSKRRTPGGLYASTNFQDGASGDGSAGAIPTKRTKSELSVPKLPASGYPSEFPWNKDGFRYILAEPDPHAPFRKEFDEGLEGAGKPIPRFLCRKWIPTNAVQLAMHDRAPQLKISDDRLAVTGDKGYSMVRGTHNVSHGTWYYEFTIEDQPEGSHCRVGWAQECANLQAPLGYDKFGYSWRSRHGTAFHQSHGRHFHSKAAFQAGDTLGLLIHLPPFTEDLRLEDGTVLRHRSSTTYLPSTYKDRPLIRFKSFLYFEEKDEAQKLAKNLTDRLPGSRIIGFKNGQLIGTLFKDLFTGSYFPAVSVFKSVTVKFNFGPDFTHPISELKTDRSGLPAEQSHIPLDLDELKTLLEQARPMSEMGDEAIVEQVMADCLFFVENEDKLKLDLLYD